ncbi:MAG: flagellar FlbD family protein [Oscillospiraceae bacterium]|nr:flagellar FlbD family protein [Oscillospiraceae bacterium]
MGAKIILTMANESRLWLNPGQIVKMECTPEGRYYVFMTNGEVFEVNRRAAGAIENYFECR